MQQPSFVPPPPPSLNGGLYTGEPFAHGAPWANVPATPDASYMVHFALRSANPPPGAIYQYPAAIRPGNSYTYMYGVSKVPGPYPIYCVDKPSSTQTNDRFSKYAYL
jgi:hypothetical protein